ncbi:MAG: 1-acyl-sn-glycerol-3-phosphate acyltransferase [Acidobacteria bacterium]|nr:1-acyl-sn-glycerol-3-phosphate acyltransferase [Acidobacteriota bacterium]
MASLGLDFPTEWSRSLVPRGVRRVLLGAIALPLTRRLTSLSVRGVENIPRHGGPLIFTANHTSHLDTPLALAALPGALRRRTVVAAAADTFFTKTRTAFITVLTVNAIPIERHKVNRRSAEQAISLLQRGWHLIIYPEGGRTPTGPMLEFKGGPAYLAERSDATIVPTFILGAGEWLSSFAKAEMYTSQPRRWRSPVTVAFGPPLRQEEGENIRRFGQRIQDAVVALGREVTGDPTFAHHLDH